MDEQENKDIINNYFNFVNPIYKITTGELAKQIFAFKEMHKLKITKPIKAGLVEALYSTYISYLP